MLDVQKWCAEHDAISRTEKAFYEALKNYKEEDAEEYGEVFNDNTLPIVAVPDKVFHGYSLPNFDFEQIYVDFLIEYGNRYVGWYRMIYDLDGSEVDDSFVIE